MTSLAEITFLMSYRCPHCGTALEARTGRVSPWLKCPKCQRGSQPPEHVARPRVAVSAAFEVIEDVVVIGPANAYLPTSTAPMSRPVATRLSPPRPADADIPTDPLDEFAMSEPLSIRRVVLTTLLFVSVMMLLFTFLAQNSTGMQVAGASSLICLLLLIIPSRS